MASVIVNANDPFDVREEPKRCTVLYIIMALVEYNLSNVLSSFGDFSFVGSNHKQC